MRRVLGFATLLLFLLGAFAPATLRAAPVLPGLFSDHMVLQRDCEIRVWGRASPAEKIAVALAGTNRETAADAKGNWAVALPARPAGGPFVLEVRGDQTVRIKDVMIGEVWVASGQSNMTFALSGAQDAEKEMPRADFPGIRFFTVPRKAALTPQADTLPATWHACTPETAKDFSAAAYFFARKLHESLGVTVGIILSAWPGTTGEEWTDSDSLRREPPLQPIAARWESYSPEVKAFASKPAPFELEYDGFELLPAAKGAAPAPLFWSYDWAEAPETVFEAVTPGRSGSAVRVSGVLDAASSSRLLASFKIDSSTADLRAYSAIRFWARGHGSFQFQSLQPTITDWDNYQIDVIQADADWRPVTVRFADLRQAGWGVRRPLTLETLSGFQLLNMASVGSPARPPSGLYNGMIAPLTRYRIRGALWYQGESNAPRADQYRALLPALIKGWRKAWGQGDFPFIIVQLPNHGSSPELGESNWAELREAQLSTARTLPNAGLAVAIDVGESGNLHPPRKKEIGERLALWALGTTYGEKIVYSGPLYESARIDGIRIRIRFSQVGSGLEAPGGELKGFSIAGADRKFHWAEARIDGDGVEVSCPNVHAPVSVRYDWAGSPDGNLFNKGGLPASPFRTDDWPISTAANR